MHLRVTRQSIALQGKQMIQDPILKPVEVGSIVLCVIGVLPYTTVGQHLPPGCLQ